MRFILLLPLITLFGCSSQNHLDSIPLVESISEGSVTNSIPQDRTSQQGSNSASVHNSLSTIDKEYLDLVTKLKVLPSFDDAITLKKLYVQTNFYKPFIGNENEVRLTLQALIENKQWKQCSIQAKKLLKTNYLSLSGHYSAMACAHELKRIRSAAFHKKILNYLLDDIWNSGDGLTPKTALIVISSTEIESFLDIAGLQIKSKTLLDYQGKAYEKVNVQDVENKAVFDLFFNVSIAWDNGFKSIGDER